MSPAASARTLRAQVLQRQAELRRHTLGNERAMTSFRVPLNAEEGRRPVGRHRLDDRREVDPIQALADVALHVVGRQLFARPLADALARVFGVLKVPQLRRRRELGQVLVLDSGPGESVLEALRVRPRVLASAYPAPLADIEQLTHVGLLKRVHEVLERPAVDADCYEPCHVGMLAAGRSKIRDVPAPDRHGPVALFDSGVGGLTVLHECLVQIPHEDFLYLGDTARFPYGDRSLPELRDFSHELAEILVNEGAKMLVVACNSATSASMPGLREDLRGVVDVISVVEPESRL